MALEFSQSSVGDGRTAEQVQCLQLGEFRNFRQASVGDTGA